MSRNGVRLSVWTGAYVFVLRKEVRLSIKHFDIGSEHTPFLSFVGKNGVSSEAEGKSGIENLLMSQTE